MKRVAIPCEECISLAMCVAKTDIDCSIILGYLNQRYPTSTYPEWPNISKRICKVLRGTWCVVALNNSVYKLQKNRSGGNRDWHMPGGNSYGVSM